MFICKDCNKPSSPGQKANVVPTGTRSRDYFLMKDAFDDYGNPIKIRGEQQGSGWEMTGQKTVCTGCIGAKNES